MIVIALVHSFWITLIHKTKTLNFLGKKYINLTLEKKIPFVEVQIKLSDTGYDTRLAKTH